MILSFCRSECAIGTRGVASRPIIIVLRVNLRARRMRRVKVKVTHASCSHHADLRRVAREPRHATTRRHRRTSYLSEQISLGAQNVCSP